MQRPERFVRPAAVMLAVVAGLGCVLLGVTSVLAPAPPAAANNEARPAAAPPAALLIPDLGLELNHVVALGVTPGGRREQPGTARGVGWFADGPAPGTPGVAVLSAHSAFGYSPGAFAFLGRLKPGATVTVRDAEGRQLRFTVRKTAVFPADEPDGTLVAPEGPGPELRLITSDGTYDSTGLSDTRVAVYATPA
ncbi:class F sortase [Amycolatopsis tolypomycina]|uniref:Sortase family protein n=1 Tax=Amycolatopsis tolypomycina TaxID=208445 RepID=A0A1H4SEQ9_9PSEU|nr:class F sortase [Amycolatopsis tolypomycina]SEC42712.1 Sortase family protein [Amycolatopsis tolypomycina]